MAGVKDIFLRKTTGTYYPGLDALRVYSIVFVLIAHIADSFFSNHPYDELTYKVLENGSNGVRIFFGISGFVIFHILKSNSINLNFYIKFVFKRFKRLEPAYLVIVTLVFFAYSFYFNKLDCLAYMHWLSSLFYLHGFIYDQPSYFFPIAWSLELEFWFYLIAPIIMFLINEFPRLKNYALLLVLIGSITYDYYGHRNMTNILYYLQYFTCGIFVALNKEKITSIFKTMREYIKYKIIWEIILIVILLTLFLIDMRSGDIINNIVSTLLLIFLISMSINLRLIMLPNWMAFFGLVTYYIYLLHPLFIKLLSFFTGFFNLFYFILISIPLIFLFSSLFYLAFEILLFYLSISWRKSSN